MNIAILHRGRFVDLPGVQAERTGPNVVRVTVPKTPAVRQRLRYDIATQAFDDAVWLVDDEESVQSLGSAESAGHVVVTVLLP